MTRLRPSPASTEGNEQRIRLLAFGALASFLAITLGLVRIQLIGGERWQALAARQRVRVENILPRRGEIFVRDPASGELFPLATNMTLFACEVVPRQVREKEKTAKHLAAALGLDEAKLLADLRTDRLYLPPIARRLPREKAEEIEKLALPGVYIKPEQVRVYPEGSLAAHLLGFVNAEGKGQYGLEEYYHSELSGKGGRIFAERDPRGRYIGLFAKEQPRDGTKLVLTIDRTIQFRVEEALKRAVKRFAAEAGLILVMDPKTGALLALAGEPTFDPNRFNEVSKEDLGVFKNRAIQEVWEPGSVFKPITAAIGLDSGRITPETTRYFEAKITVQGHDIWTFDKKPHGVQGPREILETSNNVGAVFLASEIGKELTVDYLRRFGFGQPIGIELAGEVTGAVNPPKAWKEIDLATRAFGQGIAVTPLQLLTAMATFANGGKLIQPHIIEEVWYNDGRKERVKPREIRDVIKPETARQVADFMVSVVERGHGKRAAVSGYKVAGKTGTAQVPRTDGRGYEEGVTIGSFIGFAPQENPRFIMLVRIDKPKGVEFAESSAAPLFGELASWLLRSYFQVPPGE